MELFAKRNSVKDKNLYVFETKKDHKLETLEWILKKTAEEFWKVSSLSPKKLGEFLPKKECLKNTDLLPTNKHN